MRYRKFEEKRAFVLMPRWKLDAADYYAKELWRRTKTVDASG
jgi:hypothetical protein